MNYCNLGQDRELCKPTQRPLQVQYQLYSSKYHSSDFKMIISLHFFSFRTQLCIARHQILLIKNDMSFISLLI